MSILKSQEIHGAVSDLSGRLVYSEKDAPPPPRELSMNERVMQLMQRMELKDQEITELKAVIESMAAFIGYK